MEKIDPKSTGTEALELDPSQSTARIARVPLTAMRRNLPGCGWLIKIRRLLMIGN